MEIKIRKIEKDGLLSKIVLDDSVITGPCEIYIKKRDKEYHVTIIDHGKYDTETVNGDICKLIGSFYRQKDAKAFALDFAEWVDCIYGRVEETIKKPNPMHYDAILTRY